MENYTAKQMELGQNQSQSWMSTGKRQAVAVGLAGLLTAGCGSGVPDKDYRVTEYLGDKVMTLGIGYKYDIHDRNGQLAFQIKPNYSGMASNVFLADNYSLFDKNGKVLNTVDGKIITISSAHTVYNPTGKAEKTISMNFGASLIGRFARNIFGVDGFYVKNLKGDTLVEIEETWASVLSPFLREYEILDPQTKRNIGVIRNDFTWSSFFGAQDYDIKVEDKSPETAKNLALIMRVVDRVEDNQDASSSSSSSNSRSK